MLDPRFLTNEKRVANVVALDEIIGGFIAAMTLSEALKFFERAEVTVGPIYDAAQLMENEHVRERGSIVEVPGRGRRQSAHALRRSAVLRNPGCDPASGAAAQ